MRFRTSGALFVAASTLVTLGAPDAWRVQSGRSRRRHVQLPPSTRLKAPAKPSCRPERPRSPPAPRTSPTTARCTRRTPPAKSCPTWRPSGRRRKCRAPAAAPPERDAATKPDLLVPGTLARYVEGLAAAARCRPRRSVQEIVWAANQIDRPALHLRRRPRAPSSRPATTAPGTVSFALHGGSLLTPPEDSSEFMTWGSAGAGTLGDDLLQPRPRLHDGRGAAAGHQRRRRPDQPRRAPAGAPCATATRLRRPPPARSVGTGSGESLLAGRSAAPVHPCRGARVGYAFAGAGRQSDRSPFLTPNRRIRWPG